jgi:hypothetical protein
MSLLPFFPKPLPDELLFSLLCRLNEALDLNSTDFGRLIGSFTGKQTWVNPLFPVPVKRLLELVPPGVTSERELIQNNTLLPFLKPFVASDFYPHLLKRSLYGKSNVLSEARRTHMICVPSLLFCPKCASDDKTKYGTPYLRRTHQLPCCQVCPDHLVRLVSIPAYSSTGYRFFHLSSRLDPTTAAEPEPEAKIVNLARDLASIPTIFGSHSADELWPAIHWNMGDTRLKLAKGATRLKFLEYAGPFNKSIRLSSISETTLKSKKRLRRLSAPALALLCIRFGGRDPVSFVRELKKFDPAKSTNRPCLNSQCAEHGQKIIPSSGTPLPRTGYLIFRCPQCGFAYLLNGATKHKDNHNLVIYSLGEEKDKQFRQMWLDPQFTFPVIRTKFSLTYHATFYVAHYLRLPLDRNGLDVHQPSYQRMARLFEKREQKLNQSKHLLLIRSAEHPKLSFNKLRHLDYETMSATGTVKLFDPEWMREHFGVRRRVDMTQSHALMILRKQSRDRRSKSLRESRQFDIRNRPPAELDAVNGGSIKRH